MTGGGCDEKLVLRAQQGDEKALERLLEKYKSLVCAKCRSFYVAGASYEDLVQEGMIGLFRAVKDFDAAKNDTFSAFASLCIRRRLVSVLKAANRKKNIPLNTYISLSNPLKNDTEGRTLGEVIEDLNGDPEEIVLIEESEKSMWNRLKASLSDFEKQILAEYLQKHTYEEIAQALGITKKSVDNAIQRIKQKVFRIMRSMRS